MYELGQQRGKIKDEFWWRVYGFIFGYGYQPWRFLLIVITVALIGAYWYYLKYYPVLAVILNNADKEIGIESIFRANAEVKAAEKKIRIIKLGRFIKAFEFYDHSKISRHISSLYRFWHAVFFSFSVLLGIRWKKEWSDVRYRMEGLYGAQTFLRFVTCEYLLGLCLYVIFAILVKGSRFEYIKGLLGF